MKNRPLSETDKNLITLGQSYSSLEEFQLKSKAKYLVAKRKNLLKVIFPTHTCTVPPNYLNPEILEAKKQTLRIKLLDTLELIEKAQASIDLIKTDNALQKLTKTLKKDIKDTL